MNQARLLGLSSPFADFMARSDYFASLTQVALQLAAKRTQDRDPATALSTWFEALPERIPARHRSLAAALLTDPAVGPAVRGEIVSNLSRTAEGPRRLALQELAIETFGRTPPHHAYAWLAELRYGWLSASEALSRGDPALALVREAGAQIADAEQGRASAAALVALAGKAGAESALERIGHHLAPGRRDRAAVEVEAIRASGATGGLPELAEAWVALGTRFDNEAALNVRLPALEARGNDPRFYEATSALLCMKLKKDLVEALGGNTASRERLPAARPQLEATLVGLAESNPMAAGQVRLLAKVFEALLQTDGQFSVAKMRLQIAARIAEARALSEAHLDSEPAYEAYLFFALLGPTPPRPAPEPNATPAASSCAGPTSSSIPRLARGHRFRRSLSSRGREAQPSATFGPARPIARRALPRCGDGPHARALECRQWIAAAAAVSRSGRWWSPGS